MIGVPDLPPEADMSEQRDEHTADPEDLDVTEENADDVKGGQAHEIVSPRDTASGLPSGKRQHKPFTITKEIDKSTP
jgi:type VI secretion system secreted protein Hcp